MGWIKTFVGGQFWWIILVLLIALGSLFTYHKITFGLLSTSYEESQRKVGELQTEVSSKTAQITKLSDSLATQNKAVEDLISAGVARTDAANKAIASEKAQAAKWKAKYTEILNAPPPSEDDCKALGITLDQYILTRQQEQAESAPDRAN